MNPIKLRLLSSSADYKDFLVIIYDLPVLIINTPDGQPIMSKSIRTENCSMKLIDGNGNYDLGEADIKGRGNSTWEQPKKPYNIKLKNKKSILGMKSSKHWILLANAYFDRTQLHNATAFFMASLTDYQWVQSGEFVELILNNEHLGLYYLCEKIRVEKGKIDIKELKPEDTSGENLSGGYLLESGLNERIPNPKSSYFITNYFNKTGNEYNWYLSWHLKNPEEDIPQVQSDYIKQAMNHMESLIYDEDSLMVGKYRDYLDIESCINWWLVEEVAVNEESSRTKNFLLYKDRGGKFTVGPPWDFDAYSFGYLGTGHFVSSKTAFYYRKLHKDPYYVRRMQEKWNNYKDIWMDKVPAYIDEKYELIHKAAERNELMWPNYESCARKEEMDYKQSVEELKKAIKDQIEWMDVSIKYADFTDWYGTN